MKDNITVWKFNNKILKSWDYKLNNKVAEKISKKSFFEICEQYTHISSKNMEKLLKLDHDVWKNIKGIGVDLGGGIGLVSSIIAKKKNIKKIYCVDIVKNAVTKCQPIIKKKILNNKSKKVLSVVGSFDELKLKNNSIDFCIGWDSMHHSTNIIRTLKEAKRVIKKGGKLIIVDRGHNNNTPNKEISRMLNIIYPKSFLRSNYLPINKKLTRTMNGEHEYRFFEWENFFKKSKFKILKGFIVKESSLNNTMNNDSINEKKVNFKIGGFERKKIIYLLKK